jgi:hypothetical protein
MTPEQRATLAVQDVYAKHAFGYDPNQHAEFETAIAAAIRDAVAEERERLESIMSDFGISDAVCQCCGDHEYSDTPNALRCTACCKTCTFSKGKWIAGSLCPSTIRARGDQ